MTALATRSSLQRPLFVHGSPNWADLHSADIATSLEFYKGLFGWESHTRFALTEGRQPETVRVSHLARLEGREVAEISSQEAMIGGKAAPSSWTMAVSVVNVDATLERVIASGGTVMSGPQMRGSQAITALVSDASDALLQLWEPLDFAGTSLNGAPGCLSWFELETDDLDQAIDFYGAVFGWTAEHSPLVNTYYDRYEDVRGDYVTFSTSLGPSAGAIEPTMPGLRASWCPAFSVNDVDFALSHAVRLGAVVVAEPYDIPRWREAAALDPTGSVFGLVGPRTVTRRL